MKSQMQEKKSSESTSPGRKNRSYAHVVSNEDVKMEECTPTCTSVSEMDVPGAPLKKISQGQISNTQKEQTCKLCSTSRKAEIALNLAIELNKAGEETLKESSRILKEEITRSNKYYWKMRTRIISLGERSIKQRKLLKEVAEELNLPKVNGCTEKLELERAGMLLLGMRDPTIMSSALSQEMPDGGMDTVESERSYWTSIEENSVSHSSLN